MNTHRRRTAKVGPLTTSGGLAKAEEPTRLNLKAQAPTRDLKTQAPTHGDLKAPAPTRRDLKAQAPTHGDLKAQAPTYRDLKAQAPTYRDLKAQAPTHGDLKAQAPTYRDLKAQAPTHRDLKAQAPTHGDLKEEPSTCEDLEELSTREHLKEIVEELASGIVAYQKLKPTDISKLRLYKEDIKTRVHWIESLLKTLNDINDEERSKAEETLALAYAFVLRTTDCLKWDRLATEHRLAFDAVKAEDKESYNDHLQSGDKYYEEAKIYIARPMKQSSLLREAAKHYQQASLIQPKIYPCIAKNQHFVPDAKKIECDYIRAATSEKKMKAVRSAQDLYRYYNYRASIPEMQFSSSELLMGKVAELKGFSNDITLLPILLRAYLSIREKENNTLRLFQPLQKKSNAVFKLLDYLENKPVEFSDADIDALLDSRVLKIIAPFKDSLPVTDSLPALFQEKIAEKIKTQTENQLWTIITTNFWRRRG